VADDISGRKFSQLPNRAPSPRRIAANRRNALKSTGPKSSAGKLRAALNARCQGLCPQDVEQELRARGEDPREFCRLHLDLIAIFQPKDGPASQAVELLAITWWKKTRRLRQWIGSGPAPCDDLDAQLEALIVLVVNIQRRRRERWGVRLTSVLGRPIGSPANVRNRIEHRLFLFGARPGKRKYPRDPRPTEPAWTEFGQIPAPMAAREPTTGRVDGSAARR
jgi:hypothetical protein